MAHRGRIERCRVERTDFEQRQRAAGQSDLSIRDPAPDGKTVLAADRDVYFPIVYSVSPNDPEEPLGLDVGQEPLRREALNEAVRSRLEIATRPITKFFQRAQPENRRLPPRLPPNDPASLWGFTKGRYQRQVLLNFSIFPRPAPLVFRFPR